MAGYLVQVSYTPQAWSAMVGNPQNRTEAIRPAIEELGGSIKGFWIAFGEYDVVGIIEFPDNVAAGAFSMAVAAGGAVKSIKTTPLLSLEEGLGAMERAGKLGYKPPGS